MPDKGQKTARGKGLSSSKKAEIASEKRNRKVRVKTGKEFYGKACPPGFERKTDGGKCIRKISAKTKKAVQKRKYQDDARSGHLEGNPELRHRRGVNRKRRSY